MLKKIVVFLIVCFLVFLIAVIYQLTHSKTINWVSCEETKLTPSMVKKLSDDHLVLILSVLSKEGISVSEPAPKDIREKFLLSLRRDGENIAKKYKVPLPTGGILFDTGPLGCYMIITKWGIGRPEFRKNWVNLISMFREPKVEQGDFPTIYFRNGSIDFVVGKNGDYTLKIDEGTEVKICGKIWIMREGQWVFSKNE